MRALRHVKAIAVHRAAGHPDDAVEPAALRDQGGIRGRHGGDAGLSVVSRACRSSPAARRGWAAATCARATSSPSSRTCAAAAAALFHRRDQARDARSPVASDPDVRDPGSFSMRGHSVGGYGSVTTNKVIATIAGEVFGMDVQAYPKYGSEKKGLPTTYYLTDREPAHPRALRAGARRVRRPQRRECVQPGEPADGALRGRNGLRAKPQAAIRRRSGHRFPPGRARRCASKNVAAVRAGHGRDRAEVSSRADLQQRMQGIVLLGIFLRITPFQAELLAQRRAIFRGRREVLAQVFRQARRAGGAGQPEGRRAGLSAKSSRCRAK